MKDQQKCDSLKVAYYAKTELFNDLVKSNLEFFNNWKKERDLREEYQKKLDESVKAIKKKKKSWVMPAGIGALTGITLGLIFGG